jgi:hypothetical protein
VPIRDPGDPITRGAVSLRVAATPASSLQPHSIGAHHVEPVDRFDRADEHGGRTAVEIGHHVEAVVHPVDKVHVGVARRACHDRVPCGGAKAGVRRQILRTAVRLGLHDPTHAPTGHVVTHDERAEQESGGRRAVDGQPLAGENA